MRRVNGEGEREAHVRRGSVYYTTLSCATLPHSHWALPTRLSHVSTSPSQRCACRCNVYASWSGAQTIHSHTNQLPPLPLLPQLPRRIASPQNPPSRQLAHHPGRSVCGVSCVWCLNGGEGVWRTGVLTAVGVAWIWSLRCSGVLEVWSWVGGGGGGRGVGCEERRGEQCMSGQMLLGIRVYSTV